MNSVAAATAGLPEAVQLSLDFDAERLAGELEVLSRTTWKLQNTYSSDGTLSPATIDWRVLPLRNIGGDPHRTDAGGPGLIDFAPTPWLGLAPYFAEVLDSIPAQLRSVRLMALGPGAIGTDHSDTKQSVAWGAARLHIPVTTTAGARLHIDGHEHHWQPGTFWFGDFSRPHRVENAGPGRRVHLVIDALPSKALIELFPAPVRSRLDPVQVLFGREPVPLAEPEARGCRVAFDLPASFADWEEPEGGFLAPQQQLPARIEPDDAGALTLVLSDRPAFGLVHLGGGEFRFTGWTDERTVRVIDAGPDTCVVLRTRASNREYRATVPAVRL
jgi:hypothetical protein